MATKNQNNQVKVTCNFAQVFAQFKDIETLKMVANDICQQVKTNFEARAKELKSATGAPVAVSVETKKPTAKGEQKAKAEKKPEKKERKRADGDVQISLTDKKAVEALGLKWEKYSEKCWVLRGNTKPIRDVMMGEYKGRYNSFLTGGAGMVFANKYVEAAASALGMKVAV